MGVVLFDAKPALERLCDWYERISLIWPDSAYAGKLIPWAKKHLRLALEIVKRSDDVSVIILMGRRLARSASPQST
ncbi:hypothetical protein [Streptosporangium sp. KLBMP 9127]|nr:hypothetical protein [Streptosporangium sp. KLBMP 9127]